MEARAVGDGRRSYTRPPPLADIWNESRMWAVIANGRYYNRAALDRLLVGASAKWGKVGEIEHAAQHQP